MMFRFHLFCISVFIIKVFFFARLERVFSLILAFADAFWHIFTKNQFRIEVKFKGWAERVQSKLIVRDLR